MGKEEINPKLDSLNKILERARYLYGLGDLLGRSDQTNSGELAEGSLENVGDLINALGVEIADMASDLIDAEE